MLENKISIRFINKNWKYDLQSTAMNTVNRMADDAHKLTLALFRRYLISEHSPIRSVLLEIVMREIPYPSHVCFARHVHTKHFVSTNRPDRTGKERSINDTCTHIMHVNLQSLIDMARKRLCKGKVDPVTYEYMRSIRQVLIDKGGYYKVIGEVLVPNCVYRCGCPEFKSCGFFSGNMRERYNTYE